MQHVTFTQKQKTTRLTRRKNHPLFPQSSIWRHLGYPAWHYAFLWHEKSYEIYARSFKISRNIWFFLQNINDTDTANPEKATALSS